MSDETSATASPLRDLQFDRVDAGEPGEGVASTAPATPATQHCQGCRQRLSGVYYEVGGLLACTLCRDQVEAQWRRGSAWARFGKALLAGAGAAVAGGLLYYAVRKLTGYELSIIAIAVGIMVGKAVRWGTAGRGGKGYQWLAVLLTYLAIGSTFLPALVENLGKERDRPAAKAASTAPGTEAAAGAKADPPAAKPFGLAQWLLGIGAILLLAAALPVLVGVKSPILFLIVAIGLFEAWKHSRPVPLIINGPFTVGSSGADAV